MGNVTEMIYTKLSLMKKTSEDSKKGKIHKGYVRIKRLKQNSRRI